MSTTAQKRFVRETEKEDEKKKKWFSLLFSPVSDHFDAGIIIFVLINVGLFAERFYLYCCTDAKTGTFELFSWGLPIARGAAQPIKFNSAILLFTVMRNFLTFLRSTSVARILPLDKNIVFHKGFAWAIAFWVAVHGAAHNMNYFNLSLLDAKQLPFLPQPEDANERFSTWWFAWQTVPGATGHLLVITMAFMYSSAITSIRRPMFEFFWYTHHLFILYYILLICHGFPGLLEQPNAYMFVTGPLLFYLIERGIRVCRGNEDTVLLMAVQHPGDVLELRMKKNTFVYQPGVYLFLNVPYLSSQEWHPFTITSAPEQEFVSVHIRIVGDWTGALKKLLNPNNELGVVCEAIATAPDGRPICRIDGPFGTASEEAFTYKTVILVGGGIGVTPFASILRSMRYRMERERATGIATIPIKKAYFYWLSREAAAFEWFSELLSAIEDADDENKIEIHTYLTGGPKKTDDIKKLMMTEASGERDVVTGLKSRTSYGRPNWDVILAKAMQDHKGDKIGIFFCGPAAVSKNLYQVARKLQAQVQPGDTTSLHYNKENF
jgi:predicted ferric reductase